MNYASAAPLYLERGFQPIPCKSKRPVPAGATGRHGTVDEAKVRSWMSDPEWAYQNTALRAGPREARIDVDHYGDKRGADQLAELEAKLGPLPATPSSTSRGKDSPSRQHFFLLHEPIELVGKASADIDIIQSHHRYSLVAPSTNAEAGGAPYVWYDADGEPMDAPPRLEDLEYLPEAWVEWLRADEKEHEHQAEQWDGDMPEVASDDERRKLRAIINRLEGLPDVWAPGSGWHDVVYGSSCWLWRIARSNAYAITPDQALQLLLDHAPTYGSAWPVDRIIEQWESAEKSTVGQFEPPPAPKDPSLLEWTEFPTDRAFPSIGGQNFFLLWNSLPEKDGSGALWGRRQLLLNALLRSEFTEQEAATIVWHSAAAKALPVIFMGESHVDPHGRCITERELWREVEQAKEKVSKDSGDTVEAAPQSERPSLEDAVKARHELLTPKERELLGTKEGEWWGSAFVEWAHSTFGSINDSYYRANRWTVLSVIFGNKALLAAPGGNHRRLTLYQMLVGPTTSGKSTALNVVKNIFKAYFLLADSADIGGDHTPESLAETLIARDGMSSWFHKDEAHEAFSSRWKRINGPFSGIPGLVTELYDGEVGAIYRATKKEISGKGAEAFLTVHLMGTRDGMIDVIEPKDWTSGLIPRFVWAIGEKLERNSGDRWLTDEDFTEDQATQALSSASHFFQQWASEFAGAAQSVSSGSGKPFLMGMSKEVRARWARLDDELYDLARKGGKFADRLEATLLRLAESTMRAAGLVALSRGRRRIEMSDLLIAIEQAEEWVANAQIMVRETEESLRTRQINAVERSVLHGGGMISLAALNREYPDRRRDVDDWLGELVAQGRVSRQSDPKTKVEMVKIKGVLGGLSS